jgi:hypothetical protein
LSFVQESFQDGDAKVKEDVDFAEEKGQKESDAPVEEAEVVEPESKADEQAPVCDSPS